MIYIFQIWYAIQEWNVIKKSKRHFMENNIIGLVSDNLIVLLNLEIWPSWRNKL